MPVYFLSEKEEAPRSDYFGSYTKLSKILPTLTYHIEGRPFRVVMSCNKLADAQAIRKEFGSKDNLEITVLVAQNLFEKLSLQYPTEVRKNSRWDLLEELISERRMLFDKGCVRVLYNAVDSKNKDGFEQALIKLQEAYPGSHVITREDIAKYYYVQDVVFPREVLIEFLLRKRSRWKMYRLCKKAYPASLIFYAMRENLDKIISMKGKYYETGKRDYLSTQIPASNIARMKSMFLMGIKDPFIILKLYEGGIQIYDSCQ